MQSRLGADLATVRVHTDAQAAHATAAHGARALTLGEHVFFAPGRFAPHTTAGAARLAHELVHVLQQRAGLQRAAVAAPRAAEAEARALGAAVGAGGRVTVHGASAGRPQLDGPEPASTDQPAQADSERLALRHYLRWWLGSALVLGAPPALPSFDVGSFQPTLPQLPQLPRLTLMPQLFAPLPPTRCSSSPTPARSTARSARAAPRSAPATATRRWPCTAATRPSPAACPTCARWRRVSCAA